MTYRSFDEWSSLGYKIIKGSKASWVDSKAVFSNTQVVKHTKYYPDSRDNYDYHYKQDSTPKERDIVYYADGSGYLNCGGPCGPLYFDRDGNT